MQPRQQIKKNIAKKKAAARKAEPLANRESNLDHFINGLGENGKKIIQETQTLSEGLHNINPLQIGHGLANVRDLIGVQKGDKKSPRAVYWKEFLRIKVFRMGFKQATCTRYVEAWESAISLYPLPFVAEMASRLFGERVGSKTPFGRYTPWIAQVASKADKKDLEDASKVGALVQTIVLDFKPARRAKVKRDFIHAAYDSIMQNLYRYASKDDKDAPISGLDAKDIFLDELAPLVLLGFGCAKGFKETVEVALGKLPEGYEPFEEFALPEIRTEPEYVVLEKEGQWGVYHKMNHVRALFKGTKEECGGACSGVRQQATNQCSEQCCTET